jgi:hypothetical protein
VKATIFNKDGSIYREVECHAIEPYAADMVLLEGSGVYTNMSVAFVGQHPEWDHTLERAQEFDVTIVFQGGSDHRWVGAKALVLNEQIISFWHDGVWHSVTGQIVIDNMRPGVS